MSRRRFSPRRRAAPDPLRALRIERRIRLAILAGAACLMLVGIQWGLPNVESWNGDDISPDKPLRVLADWLHGAHKYPYLHWWLSAFLYAPYVAGVALLGQVDLGCLPRLLPTCFAHPERDMTVLMVLSRLLSAAMGVGIVLGTERLARALHRDRAAALAAAAICAGSATLVEFAHTSNVDVPHAFWFTWSLVAAVHVWRRGAPVDFVAFGVLAGCALATKDTIAGAYLLPGLALAGVHVARVARRGRRPRRRAPAGGAPRPALPRARGAPARDLRARAERDRQSGRARRAREDLGRGRARAARVPRPLPGRAARRATASR